jgi:hypothetical protein
MLRGVSFNLRLCAVLVNGGCHLLVFSGQSVSVPVSGYATIDVILTFLPMARFWVRYGFWGRDKWSRM